MNIHGFGALSAKLAYKLSNMRRKQWTSLNLQRAVMYMRQHIPQYHGICNLSNKTKGSEHGTNTGASMYARALSVSIIYTNKYNIYIYIHILYLKQLETVSHTSLAVRLKYST